MCSCVSIFVRYLIIGVDRISSLSYIPVTDDVECFGVPTVGFQIRTGFGAGFIRGKVLFFGYRVFALYRWERCSCRRVVREDLGSVL